MRLLCLFLISYALFASTATSEKVNLPKDRLAEVATHVIAGTVTAVYSREEDEGDWEYTRYVAEVKVDAVEKGEGLASGQLAYVRYWTRDWDGWGHQPPSTGGHRGLPSTGDRVRIYLARNAYDGFHTDNDDGGFNVIGANGFEAMPAK